MFTKTRDELPIGDLSTFLASVFIESCAKTASLVMNDSPPHVYYFAPSILPSRSANSIHVMRMCEAFALGRSRVTLFCQSEVASSATLAKTLIDYYGVRLTGVQIVSCQRKSPRAASLAIALNAFRYLIGQQIDSHRVFVSRNLYATVVLAILGMRPLVYETHQVERGWRRILQMSLLRADGIAKVVISMGLREALQRSLGQSFEPTMVIHDSAPANLANEGNEDKGQIRLHYADLIQWEEFTRWAGYVGHLYAGRGIEMIVQLADRFPNIGFLVVGGNPSDVEAHRLRYHAPNVFLVGHQPPSCAIRLMRAVDVLLMPYQRSVSIGDSRSDTAQWMSPLKMFEYMASGVPFIASRLPVLCEVLREGENCLMAEPDDVTAWALALTRLLEDDYLAERLGERAQADCRSQHTWDQRARRMLEFATSSKIARR